MEYTSADEVVSMEHRSRVFLCIGLVIGMFLMAGGARADEDPVTYRVAVKPGFQMEGQVYGQFRTPVYLLEPGLDNLLISI